MQGMAEQLCDDGSMSDGRRWRGPHPKDRDCFDHAVLPKVRQAVADLSWLRERGYSAKLALALVGDRYALRDRQRLALQRCAAGATECLRRRQREVGETSVAHETVAVDGYNVLLTLEAALSGGVLLLARDGAVRDLAAMSAHYRRVRTTRAAVTLLAEFFADAGCQRILWYLDRPVANSDRLCRLIEKEVAGSASPWEVRLVEQVDQTLASTDHIVATADSGILDRCDRWLNLARRIIERSIPDAWLVDLRDEAQDPGGDRCSSSGVTRPR